MIFLLQVFERLKRKRDKCEMGIQNLKLELKKLGEENKRAEPVISFYRNKLTRTKVNAEKGLHVLFPKQTFVLVGELNTI